MNLQLLSTIASCGDKYRERFLHKYDPDLLLANWWAALDFFLAHACFQGRRDQMSERVYGEVKEALSPIFSAEDGTANFEQLEQQQWEPVKEKLDGKIGKGKVGKSRDIKMVLGTLDFIGQLSDLNLVRYSVGQVQQGKIEDHYKELQSSQSGKGIIQVGPKIAAFYLRDVVSLYQLEDKVAARSAYCLQPVDVWVKKLAYRIGIVRDAANPSEIPEAIATLCRDHGISPIRFNQGAWYIGYHAFDILLDMLAEEQ